jgi:hypothetical protein
MSAPIGNRNAARGRFWRDAVWNALEKRHVGGHQEALQQLANVLIDKCLAGDVPALRELGDRLEGKVMQRLEISGEDGNPITIQRVERVITRAIPKPSNG